MKEILVSKEIKLIPIIIFLLAGFLPELIAQDTIIINGIVKNGADQPISDVSVGIEGSSDLPSYTNDNGEFTIKSTSTEVFLNINPSSGYKGKRVFLNNRRNLTIYLSETDVLSGNDPVRILNQTISRRNVIPALDALDVENIQRTPAFSLGQYLQGRVSGM